MGVKPDTLPRGNTRSTNKAKDTAKSARLRAQQAAVVAELSHKHNTKHAEDEAEITALREQIRELERTHRGLIRAATDLLEELDSRGYEPRATETIRRRLHA